jgi:peptide deformylase
MNSIMLLSLSRSTSTVMCFSLSSTKTLAFSTQRQNSIRFGMVSTATLRSASLRSATRPTGTTQCPQQRTFFWNLPAAKEEVDPGIVEGTDLRIVKYPHPSLRAENTEISLEDKEAAAEITDLSKQMLKVMYAADGVGLAAPQVGVNQRLIVYNPTGNWLDETILLNPKIVEYSDAKDVETEGCLSFPEMDGDVERSKWIKVEAMTLKGKKIKKKFNGWEARIFQHEFDHLDGVVYIDRLGEADKERVQPRLNELIEEFGEGGVL